MPHSFIYYDVPYADTDQMGVVYYGNYLTYFERVRTRLLKDAGVPYTEWEANGCMLPVLEANVQYRGAAHYDDCLTILGWISELGKVKLKVNCQVKRGDELLAEGYTVHAVVRPGDLKPTRLPAEYREKLEKYLNKD